MSRLIILGGSGIGMIAAWLAEEQGYEVHGFLNDSLSTDMQIGLKKKYAVVGTTQGLPSFIERGYHVFVAYVGLQNERTTYEKIQALEIPKSQLATLIHPTACFSRQHCIVGDGVLMAPYVQMSPDVCIEDQCILLGSSFVGHNSHLAHRAHLATNSVVGANVHVGRGVHVGSNAVIREKVKIGNYALVGSGAVVLNDVPENTVVVGNPARVLRMRK